MAKTNKGEEALRGLERESKNLLVRRLIKVRPVGTNPFSIEITPQLGVMVKKSAKAQKEVLSRLEAFLSQRYHITTNDYEVSV